MGEGFEKTRSIHVCLFSDERSIHTRRWVNGLRDLGHRVDLITLIKDEKNDIGGISLNAKGKVSYLFKIGKLRSLVRRINPEIFHAHFASSFGFLASFVDHPRKILSVWGDDVIVFPYINLLFRWFVRRSLRNTNYITATSNYLTKAVKNLYKSHSDVKVIAFGIDVERFRFHDRESKAVVSIGIAKTLRPKYGIDILIKAFHLLLKSYSNIRLLIAGKGEFGDRYRRMVDELGLNGKIDFVGFIDHDELPVFFSKLDVFTMPSISDGESFGVAALEASASGLPVVATNVGGVPEVVLDGITGLLVERGNVRELAEALEKLIQNPELRIRMGRAGRKYVEENYRWETNLYAMQNLYMEALANEPRREVV